MFLDSVVRSLSQPCAGYGSSFNCMDPLIGSALVGVGGKLLSGLFGSSNTSSTNKTNLEIAQMNNEFNERMMDKQQQYNIENWMRENEYNTPAAQSQRYLDAGLNPYLMMSGGVSAAAGSIDGTTPPVASEVGIQRPTDFSFLGNAIDNLSSALGQARKLDIEKSVADSQISKNDAETENIGLDNSFKRQVLNSRVKYEIQHNHNLTEYEKKHMIAAIDSMTSATDLNRQQYDLTHLKWNDLTNEQKVKNQYYASAAAANWFDARIKSKQLPYIAPHMVAQIKQVMSQADLNNAIAGLNKEQSAMVSAQILKETFGGQLQRFSDYDWFNLAEGWINASDAANKRAQYEYKQLPSDKTFERWQRFMSPFSIGIPR